MKRKNKGFGANVQQLSRLMYGKDFNELTTMDKKKVRIKKKVLE